MHHYITTYEENGIRYAEAWLQINVLGKCFCFSKRRKEIPTPKRKDHIEIGVSLTGIDEATQKAQELCEKIEKAKSLAGDLALLIKELEVEIKL